MAQRRRMKLDIANPNAAGIDVGSASHFVAVPPDRDDEPVREFTSFTEDLERLADWLLGLRDRHGGDGIDRGVLDPLVRVAGVAGPHRVSGQCPACEERLGAQVGRAGLPMAPAADELRFAVGSISTQGRDLRVALDHAAADDVAVLPGTAHHSTCKRRSRR